MVDDYADALRAAVDAARQAGTLLSDEFHRPGGPRGHGEHAEIDEEAELAYEEEVATLSVGLPQEFAEEPEADIE